MKIPRLEDYWVPAGDPRLIRKVTQWLTCRITDRPVLGKVIRRSRFLARYRSVISGAACRRDFVTSPVFIPVVRKNRKSGLGTPLTFSNVPHFPAKSEKNAFGRIRAALAICNTCEMLEDCRNLTKDSNAPVAHGFVQGGMVFVSKVTDFRAKITEWNNDHPRSLRIPTKAPVAWSLCKIPTPKQYEEYITNLTTTKDFKAVGLELALDREDEIDAIVEDYDPYDWATSDGWDDAVKKHG